MAITDAHGLSASVCVASASPHEVTLVEHTVAASFVGAHPEIELPCSNVDISTSVLTSVYRDLIYLEMFSSAAALSQQTRRRLLSPIGADSIQRAAAGAISYG